MSGTTNHPLTDTATTSHGAPGENPVSNTSSTGATGTIGNHDVTGMNSGDTKTATGNSTHQSHAKGGGEASIVPQKLQEKLPEGVERTVPNALHDTGDQGGLHRKQQ